MKQTFLINIAGTDVEVETPDRDNIVYIAGADTYLGMHLCKHFFEHKVSVYGCGESDPGTISKYCKYQKAPFSEYDIPLPPQCLNIPGERYKLIDVISMVAGKFGIDVTMDCGKIRGDDFSRYGGHRNASNRFFSSVVNYASQYRFKTWLQSNSYGNEF